MAFIHSGKSKSAIIKEIGSDNFQLLHAAYKYSLWCFRKVFQDTITLDTKHGRLKFSLRDKVIGRCLYMFREYEYDFSVRCITFLQSKDFLTNSPVHFYDVGANIGMISIGLILSGLIDQATAIEPEPRNFEYLNDNIMLNRLEQKIATSRCALGEKQETVALMLSASNYGGHHLVSDTRADCGDAIEVKSLPLDVFVGTHGKPSVIWIDVEGYEGCVFKGGEATLSAGVPVVSEISPHSIERSGMTLDEFTSIVKNFWSRYWVDRGKKFVSYPITEIQSYYEEIGFDAGEYGNIIFTT